MKVTIVLPVEYPGGGAAANRIQKFARGLAAAGLTPRVIAAKRRPADATDEDRPDGSWTEDEYGVAYKHVHWQGSGSLMPFYARRAQQLRSLMRQELERTIDEFGCDAVILYGQSGIVSYPILRLCHERGIVLVMDITEYHPTTVKRALMLQSYDQWSCMHRLLPKLDGVIAISRWLESFAKAKNIPVVHVPVLGDLQSDGTLLRRDQAPFTMTYLGQLVQRDRPHAMLDGLLNALDRGLDARLVIIGSVDSRASGRQIRQRIGNDSRLAKHVTITGWVTNEELRVRLGQSDCFVLLRGDELQTRACFPTRLPDYLRAGKPLICSGVGDLDDYFTHRHNAWVLPPGDHPELLGRAMAHLASHPDEAAEIGRRGAHTCQNEFDFVTHGARIAEFLHRLRNASESRNADLAVVG